MHDDFSLAPRLDPWSASSLLQKAIRRGDAKLATHAGHALHRFRGPAIWRRLLTIAFEDIGIGDMDLVSDATYIAVDKELREMLGNDREVIETLCYRMASAPKDRSTDYLYCAATKLTAPDVEAVIADWPFGETEGSTAAGTRRAIDRSREIVRAAKPSGPGQRTKLSCSYFAVAATFEPDCDKRLLDAAATAAKVLSHTFPMMLPIAASEMEQNPARQVKDDPIPASLSVGGLPLYTLDKHVATGKQAIKRLVDTNTTVKTIITANSQPDRKYEVAMIAAFYADAVALKSRLRWHLSKPLEMLGLYADMIGAGSTAQGVEAIVRCVQDHLPDLSRIRRELVLGRKSRG